MKLKIKLELHVINKFEEIFSYKCSKLNGCGLKTC